MKRFKVFIKRFEDVDAGSIYMDVEIRANKVKEGAAKVTASLNDIEKAVDKTITSLDRLPTNGTNAINKLKSSIQSLLEQSKKLDKQLSLTGKQKYVTSGFASNKQTLQQKDILKKNQIDFTGGKSDDRNQLLKEVNYLQSSIQSKAKLINSEYQTRIKLVNQELADAKKQVDLQQRAQEIAEKTAQKEEIQAQKEQARAQAQAVKVQAQVAKAQAEQANRDSFKASYTDLGPGNEALTEQYRAEFQALLEKLPAEQQSVAMKKLMANENKALVNSFVAEVAELKQSILASNQAVTAMDKLRDAFIRVSNASNAAKEKFKNFVTDLRGTIVTWRIIGGFIKGLINKFGELYTSAADYEEALNLYRTSMGEEYFERANAWMTRISEALYLDPKQIMQYAGGFYNLIKGLGASEEAAYKMSTNLTQLTYDLSSFLNVSDEVAHDKLQSAITGQSRAVASAGVAMQQASLQEMAYTLQLGETKIALDDVTLETVKNSIGIAKSVKNMTQAEKTYLRYIQIMRSTTKMQGDLGKTMLSPENALRAVRRQFDLLSQELGRIFIPIVLKVIPYIMILVEKLKQLAKIIASWTGYEIAPVKYDNVDKASNSFIKLGDVANDAAGTVGKAADSINRSLAPFDELNVVESESAGGSAGGVGVGGVGDSVLDDLEKYIEEYDMLKDLEDTFNNQLDTARQNFDKILDTVKLIGGALLGWKIAKKFMEDYITITDTFDKLKGRLPIQEFFSSPAVQTIGSVLGIIVYLYEQFKSINDETDRFKDAWENGDWEEYFKIDSLDELIDKCFTLTSILSGGLFVAIGVAGAKLGWFDGIVSKVKDGFGTFRDFVVEKAQEIGKVLKEEFGDRFIEIYDENIKPTIDNIKELWDKVLKPVFNRAKESFDDIIEKIDLVIIKSGLLKEALKLAVGFIRDTFVNFMENKFSLVLTLAKDKIQNVIDKVDLITSVIRDTTRILKSLAEGDWKGAWNSLKDVAVNIFKGMASLIAKPVSAILNALEKVINSAINSLRKVIDKLNDIKIVNPITGEVILDFDIPKPSTIEIDTSALDSLSRYKNGLDFVPSDYFGPVYLDYGERVLTKEENKEYMKGNTSYLNSLTRNSASANNNQLVNDLANAIINSMKVAEANRQPGITQVYIGNDKVYEGQGTYQNRQAERYGTTLIKV